MFIRTEEGYFVSVERIRKVSTDYAGGVLITTEDDEPHRMPPVPGPQVDLTEALAVARRIAKAEREDRRASELERIRQQEEFRHKQAKTVTPTTGD
jgi:hypothetical protein